MFRKTKLILCALKITFKFFDIEIEVQNCFIKANLIDDIIEYRYIIFEGADQEKER